MAVRWYSTPPPPSPARQGSTLCWVSSLRPSASLVQTLYRTYSGHWGLQVCSHSALILCSTLACQVWMSPVSKLKYNMKLKQSLGRKITFLNKLVEFFSVIKRKTINSQVKNIVRSPKFIWAPVYSCSHWLRPRNSPPPPHLNSFTRALLVSQDRRHLFVTPWTW